MHTKTIISEKRIRRGSLFFVWQYRLNFVMSQGIATLQTTKTTKLFQTTSNYFLIFGKNFIMSRRTSAYLLTVIIFATALVSCEPKVDYPDEPTVEFKSFTFADTTLLGNPVKQGTLTFSFTDGDGDIGFDTVARKNTIFMTKHKMVNNVLTQMDLLVDLNYFVERIYSDNDRHAVSGDIKIEDLNEYKNTFGDTIMYKFYIVDRAGNRSNTDSTGLIYVGQ